MIRELRLRFGADAGSDPLEFRVGAVTIFVGPNNSGKSRMLREIHEFCRGGQNRRMQLLESLEFRGVAPESIDDEINRLLIPRPGEPDLPPDQLLIGRGMDRANAQRSTLKSVLADPETDLKKFCGWYVRFKTILLNGANRTHLADMQQAGDLQRDPQTTLQHLFRDRKMRERARQIIHDALGVHFAIDPTNLGQLRVGLAERAPATEIEECGIHGDAVAFHRASTAIDDASDGVKAFIGVIIELLAGNPQVMLIDEPEAFLHPALAFRLGSEVARAATESGKRVIASTHSSAFLMGCLQSGAEVNIVRLTYRGGSATARLLPSRDLLTLMRNPLLRSSNVLSGVFYESVVVSESDTDRAFYQEINERLLRYRAGWGAPNCLFLNAQNKQTVGTLIGPLRKLGIPAAAIVDLDVLKDGGTIWSKLLSTAFVPPISLNGLANQRAAIMKSIEQGKRDLKRDGGLAVLDDPAREAAQNVLQQLADYGIFVVPGGELESWLRTLGVGGHGPNWLIPVFERLGEDPSSNSYVKPGDDDVWDFLARVGHWLTSANRKGIPTS